MQRRDLNAPDAPPPAAAYTQAIEVTGATRTLYISGQIGQRMDGTIPADIVEQSRLTWQNLEAQLKAAGMTLDNLVKVSTVLPNRGDLAAAREAAELAADQVRWPGMQRRHDIALHVPARRVAAAAGVTS